MSSRSDRDSVLFAFAAEPAHDRATLDLYLEKYPHLTEELVDLSAELRLNETLSSSSTDVILDPGASAAWEEFIGCGPEAAAGADRADLFAKYQGMAFVALAKSLGLPRSILAALRDGLVDPQSVPSGLLRRFSEATSEPFDSVRSNIARASEVPAALSFKADKKPADQGRTTFRVLVLSTPMTDEQRSQLLRECDEDERP